MAFAGDEHLGRGITVLVDVGDEEPGPTTLQLTGERGSATVRVLAEDGTGAVWFTTDGTDPRLAGGDVAPSARQASNRFCTAG